MPFRKALFALTLAGSLLRAGYADRPQARAFIQTMVERHHFDADTLKHLLDQVRPQEEAIRWIKPPAAPVRKNWRLYRSRFIEPTRIKAGLAFWREHRAALERARRDYGVPEEIIVGIIGVETIYGRRTGDFPVLDTLATLAFDYPEAPNRPTRSALFLQELEAYLVWCRDTRQDPHYWHGSYAGAMGLPQFLPSSILKWAVDFDRDGRIDLKESPEDAIGSVARYLKDHGWEAGQPVQFPVGRSAASRKAAAERADGTPEPKWSLGALRRAGLRLPKHLGDPGSQALIVDLPTPGRATEYRVGFRNFYVLTRYNKSFFYAASVADLGHAVKIRMNPSGQGKMKHRQGRP